MTKVFRKVSATEDPSKVYNIEITQDLVDDLILIKGLDAEAELLKILQHEADYRYSKERKLNCSLKN